MGEIDYDKIKIDNLYENKIMEKEILNDINIVGREFDLKGFEIPKKVRIIIEPFSTENNLMTPTLKLKRKNIKDKCKNIINSMYNENRES